MGQELSRLPICAFGALCLKADVAPGSCLDRFKAPGGLYVTLVGQLLRDITRHLNEVGMARETVVDLVFSRRSQMTEQRVVEQLSTLRQARTNALGPRGIAWDVFPPARVRVLDHERRAGLQLADYVASAILKSVEPNRYGNTESRYVELLGPVFARRKASAFHFPISAIPSRFARNHVRDGVTILTRAREASGQAPGP
jgi:hypothetical protein